MMRAENRRKIVRAAKKKYLSDPFNRYKQSVRSLVCSAIECGVLTKAVACDQCGAVSVLEGHHEDYTKPLTVEWLCDECHSARHRKTHCMRGHEFTSESVYITPLGGRVCRACAAMRARRRNAIRRNRDDTLCAAEASLAAAREILRSET